MKACDIRIRDPFVVPENGKYYLFGTTDENAWAGKADSFLCYASKDLDEWEGPFPAFKPAESFWADENFWAPEVHKYGNRYYMFASFKKEGVCRGSQILTADTITGPYEPLTDKPFTPSDWECLDATLYVEDGVPWAVFSHEWTQIGDGQFCRVQLTPDLTATVGEPEVLLTASQAGWTRSTDDRQRGERNYVTDGCYLYKTATGSLVLLWSSFSKGGYTIGQAVSYNGIAGPFVHREEPLFAKDGGHGMVFRTSDGRLVLTIHTPNTTPLERPVFFEIYEQGDILTLGMPLKRV